MAKKSLSVSRSIKRGAGNKDNERSSTQEQKQVITQIRELAWIGQHAQAISLASQALSGPGVKPSEQMDLLDLRAESYIAHGKLDLAVKDARTMDKLAKTGAHKAQAFNRLALVQMRTGDLKAAVKSATAAVKTKHGSPRSVTERGTSPALRAESLFRLSEAQFRTRQSEAAIATAQKAIALFQELGDLSGAGRTQWSLANAFFDMNRAEDSRHAAQIALELCKQAGDQYGIGNALNILNLTDVDIAERIHNSQQALASFQAAGYADRQAVVLGNLALAYSDLGLYPHCCRMQRELIETNRAMGAKVSLTYALANNIIPELILGMLETARLNLQELEILIQDLGDPYMDASLLSNQADFALAAGNLQIAIRYQKSAWKIT
jgi:tetratricopeptide (TPR) repeat protein